MVGAIKYTVEYSQTFWRSKGFSGMVYSHAGIIAEVYDYPKLVGDRLGFNGFLHGHAAQQYTVQRKERVMQQFTRLMGVEELAFAGYFDQVYTRWMDTGGQPHHPTAAPEQLASPVATSLYGL